MIPVELVCIFQHGHVDVTLAEVALATTTPPLAFIGSDSVMYLFWGNRTPTIRQQCVRHNYWVSGNFTPPSIHEVSLPKLQLHQLLEPTQRAMNRRDKPGWSGCRISQTPDLASGPGAFAKGYRRPAFTKGASRWRHCPLPPGSLRCRWWSGTRNRCWNCAPRTATSSAIYTTSRCAGSAACLRRCADVGHAAGHGVPDHGPP